MKGEPTPETTFTYSGGSGAISYTLAEVADAGTHLVRLSEVLDPLVGRLAAEVSWLTGELQRAFPYPAAALDSSERAVWLAKRAQQDAEIIAGQLRGAAENYAVTQSRTAESIARSAHLKALYEGQMLTSWGLLAPLKLGFGLRSWLKGAQEDGLARAAEGALNNGAAYSAGVLGPGATMAYLLAQRRDQESKSSGILPVVVARGVVDATGLARPGDLVLQRVPAAQWRADGESWQHGVLAESGPPLQPLQSGRATVDSIAGDPWQVSASISAMLEGSQDAYNYPPGSIGVVRIDRPNSAPAWIVHLPGTEDWSTFDSSNPFDMEGNLEGMTSKYQDSYRAQHVLVQQFIKEALQASGALPTEEVLLTGHSGGGIHAAAAAADQAFLQEVNVKMIVIAGAPVKNLEVDEKVLVLNLQNDDDIVTALDFGAPPATSQWVTVTSHRPPAVNNLADTVTQAHSLENYVEDAVALDVSTNPVIVEQQQALAAFLGVGIGALVTGSKFVYQGRDANKAHQSQQQKPRMPNLEKR